MADPVRRCLKLLVLTLVLAESVAFLGCHAKGNGEARLQRGSVSEDDSSLFRSGEVSGAERRELSTTSCKLVWVVKSGKRQCTCSTTKNCKLVCVVKNGAHWGIVKPKGLLFNAGDGSTFIMNGWNTRDVVYNARTAPGRARVTKLFTHARSMGLTVVRAMICNEGSSRMVQKSPDVFDETVLVAMDWVMREAKTFGIRLVLTFAGNWESKAVYASWYKQRSGNNMTVPDDFFRVKEMKDWYKALVRKVITRKNTITGMLYTDEPAVFSWQLMNEPRATSDLTGKTVQNWLREMAVFVKSLDKKHMVCTGVEGFYGPSDPSRYPFNPDTWAQEQGNDFVAEGKIANIDYLTVHIYPQLWIPKRPYSTMLSFTSKWILGHVEDGRKLNMPLVFEEFGWKGDDVNATQGRNGFFQVVFKETLAAAQGKQMAGTMFWALEDPAAFFSSWAVWYERDINSTISMISNYSLEINKLMKSFRFTAT
ncbi:hypothetical protein CBR_g20336 [Chara braunii]|uniref:mannan endo-1,4-beta-mannosidase n=1 Tax=Chara braunii TaxID=69332 RepID=A0A388L0E6_CHABU|nr:hypothetical protein CBR_g20336 [Chara braunii]|eukprot:GBG75712.1 hypothetical protein CBR_g20336 [Chara braunii]